MAESDLFSGNQWELPTDIELVSEAEEQFRKRLSEAGWEEEADWLVTSFGEALINAIVHGNLGIKEKSETENWREAALRVQQKKPSSKRVFVNLDITPEKVSVVIRDEGNGFSEKEVFDPTSKDALLKSSGRGFLLMRNTFNSVVYNEKGNEVTMKKTK